MTSSVRGLFVGGKSTGNTNRQQGRRTAPAAMNQAAGRPVDPPDIEVPTLSPQASMQATVLQAEKQEMAKRAQFSPYIAPKRNDDLGKLATALRNFSGNLETLVETGVQFEKAENDRAKEHAEALAAQGMAYGPFKDYAELTRNLDRVIADPNTAEPERQQAQFLLTELRARSNRIVPHIASQARILRVTQNAMGLGIAAQANPVIGKDDEGNDVYLHDVDANDPRYLQWQNQHIYGNVQLTPAEFKSVRGVIQQSTLNNMSAHNKRKVEREEEAYVIEHGAQAEQLGYNHFVKQDSIRYTQETRRNEVQALLDQPAFLGLSADARKKAQNAIYLQYLAGVRRAGGGSAQFFGDAADVFETTDKNGNRIGVYIGPVGDREKADGTPNAALLWSSTQDADWRNKTLKAATDSVVNENERRENAEYNDAYYGNGDNPGYIAREEALLDKQYDPAKRVEAIKELEQLKQEIGADDRLSSPVKQRLLDNLDKTFDDANKDRYEQLYQETYYDMRAVVNSVISGGVSVADARAQIRDNENLLPKQKAELLQSLDKVKDPAVVNAKAALKEKITGFKNQAKTQLSNFSDDDRAVLTQGYIQMEEEFADLVRERNDPNSGMTDEEFISRAANIRLNQDASNILTNQRSFDSAAVKIQSYDTDPKTGAMIGQPDAARFNEQLKRKTQRGRGNALVNAYKSKTDRMFSYDGLMAMSFGYMGQDTKGYDYGLFARKAEEAGIDPLDYLIREHEKAITVAELYADQPGMEVKIQRLQMSLEKLQGIKATKAQEVAVLDPATSRRKLVAARDMSQNLINALLPGEAASAATMDIPPPPPPVEAANFKLSGPGFIRISEGSKQQAIAQAASRVGIHPAHLAAIMSFETGGTFDPSARNSLGYVGLIQFGKWEQSHYRVNRSTSFEEQAAAAAQYLIDRGVKRGDGIDRIYAAVLIGNADGLLSSGKDGMNAKDAYGTTVNNALKELQPGGAHYKKAVRFLTGA